jgi:hypothetical protein
MVTRHAPKNIESMGNVQSLCNIFAANRAAAASSRKNAAQFCTIEP